jgi:hypothetical protein
MLVLHTQSASATKQVKLWTKMFRQAGKDLGGTRAITPVFGLGVQGLLSSAAATEAVQEYTEALRKKHELKPWAARNVARSAYVWDLGPGRTSPAKGAGMRVPGLAPLDHWGFRGLTVR